MIFQFLYPMNCQIAPHESWCLNRPGRGEDVCPTPSLRRPNPSRGDAGHLHRGGGRATAGPEGPQGLSHWGAKDWSCRGCFEIFYDMFIYISVNPQDISCLTPRFEVDVGGQYSRVQTPLLQFWVFLRSTFNGESMWKIVNPMGFQWIFLETTPMIFTTPIIFQDISHGFPISIIGNTTTSWMAAGRKDRTSTGWRGDGAGTTKPYSCVGSQGSEGSTLVPW